MSGWKRLFPFLKKAKEPEAKVERDVYLVDPLTLHIIDGEFYSDRMDCVKCGGSACELQWQAADSYSTPSRHLCWYEAICYRCLTCGFYWRRRPNDMSVSAEGKFND